MTPSAASTSANLPSFRTGPRPGALAALFVAHGLAATLKASLAAPGTEGTRPAEPTRLDPLVVEDTRPRQVSSPKFTAPLIDTPQTVAVIPREVFTQQGGATLSDVLRNTPGITFLAGEGGNASSADGDSFFMRGFDTSNSVFVDGVRDTGQFSRDVYNLEQVEIAKGPAGSDSGRGVASGFVNLSTKVPRLEEFRTGTVSYGSGDRKRATLDFNQPTGNSAAFRLNALWQDGGVAGRDLAEENRVSFAPSFSLGLGTATRVHLSYQHTRHDDRPDYGLSRAALPAPGGADSFTPLPPAVDQDTFYGAREDFDDVSSHAYTARIEHDFRPHVRLSNQTKLSGTERRAFLTPVTGYTAATGLVTRARQANQRDNEAISNLTNLSAQLVSGRVSHTLTAGLEYVYEKQLITSYTSVQGTNAANPLYDPNLLTPLTSPNNDAAFVDPIPSGASNWGAIDTVAIYAFDTIKFSERWQATGGFRWEDYEASYRTIAATASATRATARDNLLSGKIGAVYKPATNGTLYAAYGTSLRPPGTNFAFNAGATNADNLSLEPQEAYNYEVGTKWDLFRSRLAVTAALFRTENTKVASTDTATGAVVQQNDQIVEGVELGVSGRITDSWLVFGGLSLMDARFSAPATNAGAATDGARLQWTPKVSGNFWTTYRLPSGLTLGGGAQYLGETQRQTTNTPAAALPETPAYWVFNAIASYAVSDRLALRLNLNNVFDKFYLQSLNNNGNRYNPGTPRSFLVSADLRF